MTIVHRVLPPHPVETFDDYLAVRGGRGIEAARAAVPADVIAELEASGLRGRGGAGFPTGRKWRTVAANCSVDNPATVVVNAAEGEPGTMKDRTLLRMNPYEILEGALIAAVVVGADAVVIALKESFRTETARVQSAMDAIRAAGWADGITMSIYPGPSEYLYGEETALLESLDGRAPFPRIAPPFRRGVDEVVETPGDITSGSGLSAHVEMADASHTAAAPTLVDNVETMANVPRIVWRGADWFRTEGTQESPGTMVCTVTGAVQHAGVGEFPMGTPLREVIETVGGGMRPGRTLTAILPGVSSPVITADQLDAPLSYEGLAAIGSGLGSAGFIVYDDTFDAVAVAAGASRFLAVESCGQCTPCKQDGLIISDRLQSLAAVDDTRVDLQQDMVEIGRRLDSVITGARCSLATQHQVVVASLIAAFPEAFDAHVAGTATPHEPELIAELVDVRDGKGEFDATFRTKQPDWTHGDHDSGASPVDRFTDHRVNRFTDS
ncbi:MAG: NADH-quinone oxidoreductase subunit [Actinomycetia bacterium]|nr:NADH-quinone oxidoreductase subunit [Actinomycetes bacterium]